MMYGGRDDCDGAMDPTSEFSTNRRMRMNPRAFYKLSSASSLKVTVKDKAGEFVMKPVAGRPGVQQPEDHRYHLRNSKDKLALIKIIATFSTPTLSSELKTNNLVAIQKSLVGQEAKRMTVREVMANSRNRRARLFRMQMSTGRLDDWYVPGENRTRSSASRAAPGDSPARSRSRAEKSPADPKRTQSLMGERTHEDVIRARTAPPARVHRPPPANLTSRTDPGGNSRSATSRERARTTSHHLPIAEEPEDDPTPRVSVVQLRLPDSPKSGRSSSPESTTSPSSEVCTESHEEVPRSVFSLRTGSVSQEYKGGARSARINAKKQKGEALDLADQECSVQTKHLDTLRESVAVVRRWEEQDRGNEEKLAKWRMRMSFAATRCGHLGKVLARV
ncbi:hypothetical protein ACOMHN_040326 [Nucella lapillus]